MKIVTAAEMREIDHLTSEKCGVPSLTLMENAGTAVADFALAEFSSATRITIVAGKGNNGGDGFVAARKLFEGGKHVHLLLLADPAELKGDAAAMYSRIPLRAVVIRNREDLERTRYLETDLIIDAILGTGFRPPVSDLYAGAIEAINCSHAPVIAVDIPSGANSDDPAQNAGPICRANAIVTFTAPKPAHVFARLASGPTIVAPIGSPPEAIVSSLQQNVITPKQVASLIGPRRPDSNKGLYGHVLVIGGSFGKAGAAAMAGMSALRSGVGLSTVATPKSVLSTVAGFHPELMTEPLDETETGTISMRALDYGRTDTLVERKTVLAIGTGVSRNPETSEFVRTIVRKYSVPVVLDADGLNAFEGKTQQLQGKGRTIVVTPHPGEMARLTGTSIAEVQRDRIATARNFSRDHEAIVVL